MGASPPPPLPPLPLLPSSSIQLESLSPMEPGASADRLHSGAPVTPGGGPLRWDSENDSEQTRNGERSAQPPFCHTPVAPLSPVSVPRNRLSSPPPLLGKSGVRAASGHEVTGSGAARSGQEVSGSGASSSGHAESGRRTANGHEESGRRTVCGHEESGRGAASGQRRADRLQKSVSLPGGWDQRQAWIQGSQHRRSDSSREGNNTVCIV